MAVISERPSDKLWRLEIMQKVNECTRKHNVSSGYAIALWSFFICQDMLECDLDDLEADAMIYAIKSSYTHMKNYKDDNTTNKPGES